MNNFYIIHLIIQYNQEGEQMYFISKKINLDLIHELKVLFSNMMFTENSLEGFMNLNYSQEFLNIDYVKSYDSYEFIIDEDIINPKKFKKAITSNIQILLNKEYMVIYGDRNACISAERLINTKINNFLYSRKLLLNQFLKQINDYDYLIKELKFTEVKMLNTRLPSITLEFINNSDSLNIIKSLNASPSYAKLLVFSENEEECYIQIFLNENHINLSYQSFNKTSYENIKEIILNLLQGE